MKKRRVFISVLGTGFYGFCKYKASNFLSEEVRFIQLATLDYLKAEDWNEKDKMIFLLTDSAKSINWEKSIQTRTNRHTKEDEEYIGLEQELAIKGYPAQVCPLAIPDGRTEEEIWSIFSLLYKEIEDGDELYFDLTHGFRYLPMLILVFGNYARLLNEATVAHISYGNYEMREKDTGFAPIVDLLPLARLQQWTNASSFLLESGDASKLKMLCEEIYHPLNRESKGKNVGAKALEQFSKSIHTVMENRQMCRGNSIFEGKEAEQASKNLKRYQEATKESGIPPLTPILEKIEQSLLPFKKRNSGMNMLYTAKWCYDHKLYQQAYTLLQEGIITNLCNRLELSHIAAETRTGISNYLKVRSHKEISSKDWKGSSEALSAMRRIDLFLEVSDDFIKEFNSLSDTRNDFNHAGMRKDTKEAKALTKEFNKLYAFFEAELSTMLPKERLLINISNHPSNKWSEKQHKEARSYGNKVIDLPFPSLKKETTIEKRDKLKESLVEQVKELIDQGFFTTVHIMGEMVFTYQVVSDLKAQGIPCIASFGERIVKETRPNEKEVVFDFQFFTEY